MVLTMAVATNSRAKMREKSSSTLTGSLCSSIQLLCAPSADGKEGAGSSLVGGSISLSALPYYQPDMHEVREREGREIANGVPSYIGEKMPGMLAGTKWRQ